MSMNGWNRILRAAPALLIMSMLLSGCWDRLEIDERAVVLGVSIDIAHDEDEAKESEGEVSHVKGSIPPPNEGMIQVGVQIALPGRIPLGPGEAGGNVGSNTNQTVWVIKVHGHTINDAFMNLQQQVSSKLFFGHLRIIVISDELARRGLDNINDYFRRNAEIRRMAWLMVSRGEAFKLMNAAPKLERIPTLYLLSTLDNSIKMGKFPKDYIGQYWSNTSKMGQEGFLPYIEIKEEENVEIRGLAYFKGERMVGATKPMEISGFLGIKGINPAGYRAIIVMNENDASSIIMTNVTHRRAIWKLQIKDDLPHFLVNIELEANLEEKTTDDTIAESPRMLLEIEEKQNRLSVDFYNKIIRETQKKGVDIFGFGEQVRAKKPIFWDKHIRTKEDWQEMYKKIKIDFDVQVKIRRVGMKAT